MATHQASINIQEPTKFKLEATRTRVKYRSQLEPKSTNPQIRVQFENQALQIWARTLQAAKIRIRAHRKQTLSRQICTMADSATRTTSSATDDTTICGLKVIFGPTLFNFLQLTKFLKLKLWNMTPYAYFLNFWTSGVRHPLAASL